MCRGHQLLNVALGGTLHQHLDDELGVGLTVAGKAFDGTIETVEVDGHPFALGVQEHPEEDPADTRLFDALIAAAGATEPARTTGAASTADAGRFAGI